MLNLSIKGTVDIQYRPVKIWFVAIGRTRKEHYDIGESWPIAGSYNDIWKRGPVDIRLDKGELLVFVGGTPVYSQIVTAEHHVRIKNVRGVTADLWVRIGDDADRSWSGETIPIVEKDPPP